VTDFNVAAGTHAASWAEVKFPDTAPQMAEMKLWSDYVNTLPLNSWVLDNCELRYRDFLVKKHGSVEKASKAYGVALEGEYAKGVQIPSRYADELYFSENKGGMRWYFLTHNYVAVSRFLFQQGRSVTNTIILVGLSILAALVVNPVAAYALSRFRLSYTSKVLLFLLATAAFPAEVTAIPQFLLIKKTWHAQHVLGSDIAWPGQRLLDLYAQGLFDGLPKELYEAAILEGASETVIFTQITMPLAAPILALTAFGAFNAPTAVTLEHHRCQRHEHVDDHGQPAAVHERDSRQPGDGGHGAGVHPHHDRLFDGAKGVLKGIVIPTMH